MLRCWVLDTGELRAEASVGSTWITSVDAPPGQDRIAVGAWDRHVRLWRAGGSAQPTTLGVHDGEVSAVRFSTDGARVYSSSFDETVRVWDVETGKPITVLGEPRESGLCPPDKTIW